MRKLCSVAGIALAVLSAANPAEAAIVAYGFSNTSPSSYEQLRFNAAPSGTFRFNTDTNQLLGFSIDYGIPLAYVYGNTSGPQSAEALVLNLFRSASVCDLDCFIGVVNSSTYTSTSPGLFTVNFSAPLSGSITGTAPLMNAPYFSAAGNLRVTGAIPELSTWAMMLMGFGAIGATMRRRQRVTVSHQMS